jgi:hypothetical protein
MNLNNLIRLERGAGVIYGQQGGSGSSGPAFVGARNGNSVDSAGCVVFGQDQAAASNPAILLNKREIPQNGNQINIFGGNIILSDTSGNSAGGKLEVYAENVIATQNVILSSYSITGGAGVPTGVRIDMNGITPSIATPGAFLTGTENGNVIVTLNHNGINLFNNPADGVNYLGIQATPILLGTIGNVPILNIQPTYKTTIPAGLAIDIGLRSVFTAVGGSVTYTGVSLTSTINQTAGGTGTVIGFDFSPSIVSVTGQLMAFRGTVGDVLLQSNGTTGRTGVRGVTTPTAWLQIGAGAAAAGSAPLKLTTGVNQTVAEAGAIEYNGVNFFATRTAATRETIFTGVSGAAAPATTTIVLPTSVFGTGANVLTTPASWASVNVGGTVFKIPLYT